MSWPASSSQLAPAVVGDQVWTFERIRNEATPEDARQKWHHNNMAIKYARKFFEEPPGCPTVVSLRIDMREATFEIIECEHGKGELYTFQADAPKYPWSWRAFVNALSPEEAEMVVGPGLVGISLCPRPGSYDHHRAAAAKKLGHEDLSACKWKPPIWEFRFDRSNGSSVVAHPRWKRKGKMEIAGLADCPQEPVMPKAGPGKSDGKGTYRRLTEAVYPPPQAFPSSWQVPPPPPGGPTRIQKQLPPPPPPPPRPQVALAPPVGRQAAVTAAKAVVPAAHPATYDLRAAQDVHGSAVLGSRSVPASKAVAGRCAGRPSWHV